MITFNDVMQDLIFKVSTQWRDVLTDFIPVSDVVDYETTLQQNGIRYRIDGGYDDAERVRLYMTMFDMDLTRDDMDLHIISFSGNTKFINYSHRDCLGALMALGFERKCIGDIIVQDNGFDVVTNGSIDDYLLMSNISIKHVPMRAQKINFEDWQVPERKLKQMSLLVQQVRCDAIIAKAFNLSRSQSVNLIKNGLVQINHREINNPSKLCEPKQIVAVRGYGKFVINEIEGISKKGKIKLSIGKYI